MPEPPAQALARASWPLAGLTVLADWVGSNRNWFPYTEPGPGLEAYWDLAKRRARVALSEAGLAPSSASRATGLHALTSIERPSPVQGWAETADLPPGPLLVLIEDMTGGGKTEAALVLAHRLMAAGRAAGLYVTLPTMATAKVAMMRTTAPSSRPPGSPPKRTRPCSPTSRARTRRIS